MEFVLHKLYRNSVALSEMFNSQIEGTTLKEKLGNDIEKELLKSIGEDNKEFVVKLNHIEGLVNGYNKFKNFAGLSSGEVVENTGDMFGLKNCDSDHSINCVISMFYNSEMSLKDVKEKMSESYFERYLNLSFLESFLSCELSDYSAKLFLEFVNAKKELNNYTLINEYFNGFRIGVNLTRECDIFDRESVRENESIMKKVCEEKSQYSKSV